jgi:hypothetical protein
MNERDDSIRIDDAISSDVSQRVRSVISAAESAATAIRHEAEQQAQAARRQAEQDRLRYLEEARREADRLLTERIERIRALSDELIEGAEMVLMRLSGAQEVKRQLETLVQSLATTAEQLAREREGVRGAVSGFEPRPERAEAEPVVSAEVVAPAGAEVEVEFEEDKVEIDIDLNGAEPAEAEADAAPEAQDDGSRPAEVVELHPPDEPSEDRGDELLGPRLVALQMAVAGGNRGEVEGHLRRAFDLSDPHEILDDVFGRGTSAGTRVAWPEPATDPTA